MFAAWRETPDMLVFDETAAITILIACKTQVFETVRTAVYSMLLFMRLLARR
jgi:hypothetical protein